MYVCMCLKVRVNWGQSGNLEGKQNCMIVSNVTTILRRLLQNFKKFEHRHVGVYLEAILIEYCAAHSDFNLSQHI